ncbi:MAG: hypothetical protein LBR87_09445, partial [Synergistaceae bacterium]|nr:hypothetical protein [Synergistaceae bacterium]
AGPGRSETFGAITLHDPWITKNDDGTEMLILRGAASSVFHGFVRDRAPVTQVVWRGEVRPSAVTGIKTVQEGLPRFYSPNAGPAPDGQGIIQADSIQDVMNDIAEVSRSGAPLPGVIVLDTRISVPEGQETIFLGFLLQQGIRLDLWAARRPASLAMSRVSRITLGRTGWSADAPRVQGNARTEWILSVPLPPDVDTFGYPSDTTLSFMSDIDVIRFADWLPIWPSLIKKD